MADQYPLDEPLRYECPKCGECFLSRKGELEAFRQKVRQAIIERTGEVIFC